MIYVHIPYCRSFCTYCDFYSEISSRGTAAGRMSAFVDALCTEITMRAGEIPWEYNTLYIGGGTPSVLPLKELSRIVSALAAARGSRGILWKEFTIEVNPDDVVKRGEKYIRGLAELGVNRISMGVQSLDDNVLRWMNRRHTADQARQAYRIIRNADIDNISVDLIFGYNLDSIQTFFLNNTKISISTHKEKQPEDNTGPMTDNHSQNVERDNAALELFKQTIDDILNIGGDGLPPKHISAYQLSIEPGSALAGMVANGRYAPASDELCARQYEILCERLAGAGYGHYEISNFAQSGFQSRHNSAYWRHIPYIGFGPAAHSFMCPTGQGGKVQYIRLWNEPNVNSYLRAAQTGDFASISEYEILTEEQIHEEKIMLSLRTADGIDPSELPPVKLSNMLKNGSLVMQGSRVRIPESKFFVSDDIISDLI